MTIINSQNFSFIATEENFSKLSTLPVNIRKTAKCTFRNAVEEFTAARNVNSEIPEMKEKMIEINVKNAIKKLQSVVKLANKYGVELK